MSSAGRVGGGNEHDLLPQIGPHGDDRAGLEFSVDGMREKDHEVQFTIGGIRACWIRGDEQGAKECRRHKCEMASTGFESGHSCDFLTFKDGEMKKILIFYM